MFLSWGPSDEVSINLLWMNKLQYLESSEHTLLLAMLGMAQASFHIVKNNLFLNSMYQIWRC